MNRLTVVTLMLPLQATADINSFMASLAGTTKRPGCTDVCSALNLSSYGGKVGKSEVWTINCNCSSSQVTLNCFGLPIVECCVDCPSKIVTWTQVLQASVQPSLTLVGTPCANTDTLDSPQRWMLSESGSVICAQGLPAACAGQNQGDACDYVTTCSGGASSASEYSTSSLCHYTGGVCLPDSKQLSWCSKCNSAINRNSSDCYLCNQPVMFCSGAESSRDKQMELAFKFGIPFGSTSLLCCFCFWWCYYWYGRRGPKQASQNTRNETAESEPPFLNIMEDFPAQP